MGKLIKLVFYTTLIAFILSPLFVRDYGLDSKDYASRLDIENGSFIKINGYETFFIDFNENSDKTILFLHGFGGSATNWLEIIPKLSEEGYRVIAVDLKGFGFSEKKGDENYSHPSQVSFLTSFVKELDLQNIILVGHSMGANVATMYYQENPHMIEKLVLVSPALMEQGQEDVLRNNALKILDYPIIREYARVVLKLAFHDSRIDDILNSAVYNSRDVNLQEPFFVDPTIFLGWEYVAIKMAASSYENVLKNDVSEIDTPVSMIWGQEDTWVPVTRGDSLKRRIVNSDLEIIENTGHLPMLESPEEFVNILLQNI